MKGMVVARGTQGSMYQLNIIVRYTCTCVYMYDISCSYKTFPFIIALMPRRWRYVLYLLWHQLIHEYWPFFSLRMVAQNGDTCPQRNRKLKEARATTTIQLTTW